MPIVGVTHAHDGSPTRRRSVTTKLAIGLPPNSKNGRPQQLDHFIFQKKGRRGSGPNAEAIWEIDAEKTKHFGRNCREVEIILLDDDPERIFRTEYAWWSETRKECWGDGDTATRRTPANPRGEEWEPCANDDCIDLLGDRCRPSGDLYFLLADYPTVGAIAKLHTSSYQSIREMHAALEDLRNHMKVSLMGLHVKLFVRTEKSVYRDEQGTFQNGIKQVLGLGLVTNSSASGVATSGIVAAVQQLGAESIEIEDPEQEQAPAIRAEFYPAGKIQAAHSVAESRTPESTKDHPILTVLKQRIEAACAELKVGPIRRAELLAQYRNDLPALLERLTRELGRRSAGQSNSGAPKSPDTGPTQSSSAGVLVNGSGAYSAREGHDR